MMMSKQEEQPPGTSNVTTTVDKSDHNGGGSVASNSSDASSGAVRREAQQRGVSMTIFWILVLGCATSAAFLGVGVSSALKEQDDLFQRAAVDTVSKLQDAFEDYVNAVSMVHTRCRRRNFSRQDFRDLYETLLQNGLAFKAVQFYPNTTHEQRPAREAETRAYYAHHYPHVTYQGFRGFNNLDGSGGLQVRDNQSWYFPVHYQEPVAGNEAAIDLDYHSSEVRMRAVNAVFDEQAPSLSDRLSLVRTAGTVSRCGNHNGPSYGVVLAHPGVNVSRPFGHRPSSPLNGDVFYNATTNETIVEGAVDDGFVDDVWPRDLSAMVLCIPDLISRSSYELQDQSSAVYIHDLNHPNAQEPVFMGGAIIQTGHNISFLEEVPIQDLKAPRSKLLFASDINAANRVWTITVVALDGTYEPNVVFVILGGVIIFMSTMLLAAWIYTNSRRLAKWNEMTAKAQAEKAALILQSAHSQAKTERELNDFLAHEVRNPVAAAMAACNFVSVEVNKPNPLQNDASRELARDDLKIIDNALHFVNDLLRNMLDMHRAASKQLVVTMVATDLLHHVMEPVAGMLHRRGSKIKLQMECPPNLIVLTDPLRLKQVILNLGRNSSKFIDVGFIRLKAFLVNGMARIHVDDSGCGIPKDKQRKLFDKYQESLDNLSQGTGIGLYLCLNLVELMGGTIQLDPDYDSGVPGHPGSRFVIDLKQTVIEQPLFLDHSDFQNNLDHHRPSNGTNRDDVSLPSTLYELPEKMSVLFVDDDAILRKLFMRTIATVVPEWTVREAANGETALRLTEENHYDLIFCDMYMASAEKQLLGTEAVAELRNRGVQSKICGLSANDKEAEFLAAGADAFMFKPFPCKHDEINEALCRVLFDDRNLKPDMEGMAIFDS
ncbi:respiration control sensor protein ArcB [Seminavis robusta]|uniref:Respiration control sensor protein ArcB n=1 Tax=Seminavis robusta TaxID=568900 RepID=A0A9N8DLF9_9STRA|nr:respiration control sensor protein ArcB [Seminavis robusta]|eukprot:Sro144_g066890.1 respiration control sensor protein ArcB (886) ;mRNA; f:17661-20318